MPPYSLADAERDLRETLDRAPKGAVKGEWQATTMQAGHSSRTGGYEDRHGHAVSEPGFRDLGAIDEVLAKLEGSAGERFNTVSITWTKARLPFRRGKVAIETRFDAIIVPRGPHDPSYEAAAAARRRFWEAIGATGIEIAAERGTANVHAQTKWYGPHRRVLLVRHPGGPLLATDGLSTPWAGIAKRENGVECELVLALPQDPSAPKAETIVLWGDVLIGIGDLVADGHRVRRTVEELGAILFSRLGDECRPMAFVVLSLDDRRIEGLPFGSARLLRATPVTEAEVAGLDPADPWAVEAARAALRARGLLPRWSFPPMSRMPFCGHGVAARRGRKDRREAT